MTAGEAGVESGVTVADPIPEARDASVTFDMERGSSQALEEVTPDPDRVRRSIPQKQFSLGRTPTARRSPSQ